MSDLIKRADAMGAVQDHFNSDGFKGYDDGQQMMDRIKALPSAEAVSREEYDQLEALYDAVRVYDSSAEAVHKPDYSYEADMVRRLKESLSAEAVQGEWVRKYDDKVNCYWYECDQCGEYRPRNQFGHEYNANFCPNCGARMKGGDTE